ncbi:hypothetical protein [Halomonas nitroreducens]|uniref:MarR family transcriptional regulator n=1 Tax=Halomonas nitroreducens TaxID=447425 RepID=A0A431V1G7_9GAMM|nr:hypothetical protein [Halomonas nitroreducens]RTR01961.1 hypothetical protein EKG36_13210 [Halomonas nitroreducens]
MKPVDLENEVLLALRRAAGDTLTIAHLHRRLSSAAGEGPIWRQVASTCTRLERLGFIYIAAEEKVGDAWHPAYALTEAGRAAAHAARIQRHNASREVKA